MPEPWMGGGLPYYNWTESLTPGERFAAWWGFLEPPDTVKAEMDNMNWGFQWPRDNK
jgi:hypothetical protein